MNIDARGPTVKAGAVADEATVTARAALTAKDRGLLTAPSRAAITRARASFPSVRRHSDIIIALALAQHGYAKAAAAALTVPLTPANPLTD